MCRGFDICQSLSSSLSDAAGVCSVIGIFIPSTSSYFPGLIIEAWFPFAELVVELQLLSAAEVERERGYGVHEGTSSTRMWRIKIGRFERFVLSFTQSISISFL